MSARTPALFAAIVAGSPAAARTTPDAELLALGRAFDAAFAAYLAFRPHELAAEEARDAAWEADPDLTMEAMATDTRLRARHRELAAPFEPAIERACLLREQADRSAEAAFRLPPPRTLAGLAVLGRMLACFHVDEWEAELVMRDLARDMALHVADCALALAGLDRLGRPARGGA